MKKFYVLGLIGLSALAFAGCGNKKQKNGVDGEQVKVMKTNADSASLKATAVNPVDSTKKTIALGEVKGYFHQSKLKKTLVAVISTEADFKKDFHPAAVMGKNTVTKIDFTKQKVGVVVLPVTNKISEFKVKDSYLTTDSILHVTVNYPDAKKATFSNQPSYLFTFDSSLHAKAVEFNVNGVKMTCLVK